MKRVCLAIALVMAIPLALTTYGLAYWLVLAESAAPLE